MKQTTNLTTEEAVVLFKECNRMASNPMPGSAAFKIYQVIKALKPIMQDLEAEREEVLSRDMDVKEREEIFKGILSEMHTLKMPKMSLKDFKTYNVSPSFIMAADMLMDFSDEKD